MQKYLLVIIIILTNIIVAQTSHPLFNNDLSNAIYPEGIWSFTDGVLTATEDQAIWSKAEYDNFTLEVEFMTEHETNSGVIVYCSDTENWIPNSVEIQIADDYSEKWGKADSKWQCGAIFGHLAPSKSLVKKPGKWNQYKITCRDSIINVELNGEEVNNINLNKWKSSKLNPDGSEIPAWLSKPLAELPTKGHIGFQGKHAGAPIYFRNLTVTEIK